MCTHVYPSNMETAMNYLPKKEKNVTRKLSYVQSQPLFFSKSDYTDPRMVAHSESLLMAQLKSEARSILSSSHSACCSHAMFAHGMKESNQDVVELKMKAFHQLRWRSSWVPSTVEIFESTMKTFLKFLWQPITSKLQVLLNSVATTCKPFRCDLMYSTDILGPYIRGKIRRFLHKTRLK